MNAMGTGRATLTLIPYEEPLLAKAQELITKGDMTKGDFSIAVAGARPTEGVFLVKDRHR
jgi:hypothetical protein